MKLTKNQKQILSGIENKKFRKNKKKQFKLDNELLENIKESNVYIVNWDLLGFPDFARKFLYPNVVKITEETPKEFCVKITEENIEILKTTCNSERIKNLDYFSMGCFVIKRSNTTELLCDTKHSVEKNLIPIVSTEEFLRYIGKEDLIRNISKVVPEHLRENPITPDKCFKAFSFSTHEPKKNYSLGEVAHKVAKLALEKIEKNNEDPKNIKLSEIIKDLYSEKETKPLKFDLPDKEEDFNVKDYLCFDLEELFYRVNSGEITIMNLYNILREQKLNENKKSPN